MTFLAKNPSQRVDLKEQKEILALEVMQEESKDSWLEFMRKLKNRGVRRVRIFIYDAHQGILSEVKKGRLGARWQRCKVHFMLTFLVKPLYRDNPHLSKQLKQI